MLTHGNLIANTQGSTAVDKFNDQDVTLSWMPLTHDMGLIGFYLMQFANRVHIHLMPTELFVRRPLLWLQVASKKRVTITCSPNFGYRHFLKVLGDRRLEGVDLSAIRLIYNGAEPISVDLCNEFMAALAYTGLKRQAMYPVYGLAEASLAVTLPELGSDYRWVRVNRHKLAVGSRIELNPVDARDTLELMCVGHVVPNTEVRIADASRAALPEGVVGHILIRGASVTRGYFGDPEATALAVGADGWVDTGDLGFMHEGTRCTSPAAAKKSSSSTARTTIPTIWRISRSGHRAWISTSWSQRASRANGRKARNWSFSCYIAAACKTSCPLRPPSAASSMSIRASRSLGSSPTKRIPKTTSGKVQRHLLEQAYVDGEFDADLAELEALREAAGGAAGVSGTELEMRLQSICEAALPGKRIGVNDNLFDIGASSLKLIEIHENIDREFPGLVDLTELFDHPTIAELAKHLETKLNQAPPP